MLLRDYNFDEKEVRGCVKSAFSYVWVNDPLYGNNIKPTVKKNEGDVTNEGDVGRPLVGLQDMNNEKPDNSHEKDSLLNYPGDPVE